MSAFDFTVSMLSLPNGYVDLFKILFIGRIGIRFSRTSDTMRW